MGIGHTTSLPEIMREKTELLPQTIALDLLRSFWDIKDAAMLLYFANPSSRFVFGWVSSIKTKLIKMCFTKVVQHSVSAAGDNDLDSNLQKKQQNYF